MLKTFKRHDSHNFAQFILLLRVFIYLELKLFQNIVTTINRYVIQNSNFIDYKRYTVGICFI